MEINESIFSWRLRKFTQHGCFRLCRDVLTMIASMATIVVVVTGTIYVGPDFTTGEKISNRASQILESELHDNSTALTEETREALSEIANYKGKNLTKETASKLIDATKEMAPPTDCHFPWRQNACVKNILENLQKRSSNE